MNSPVVINIIKAEINFSLEQPIFSFRYKIEMSSIPFALRTEYASTLIEKNPEITEERRATTKMYPVNSPELPVFVGNGPWEQKHPISEEKNDAWMNFWLSLNKQQTAETFLLAQQNKTSLSLVPFYAQAIFSGNPAFASKLRSNTLLPFSPLPEEGRFSFYVPPKIVARAIIQGRTEEASF